MTILGVGEGLLLPSLRRRTEGNSLPWPLLAIVMVNNRLGNGCLF